MVTVSLVGVRVTSAGKAPLGDDMARPGTLLEVRGASKSYGRGLLEGLEPVTALRGLDLTNAIVGFTTTSSGQIRYRGQDVSRLDRSQLVTYSSDVQAVFHVEYAV